MKLPLFAALSGIALLTAPVLSASAAVTRANITTLESLSGDSTLPLDDRQFDGLENQPQRISGRRFRRGRFRSRSFRRGRFRRSRFRGRSFRRSRFRRGRFFRSGSKFRRRRFIDRDRFHDDRFIIIDGQVIDRRLINDLNDEHFIDFERYKP